MGTTGPQNRPKLLFVNFRSEVETELPEVSDGETHHQRRVLVEAEVHLFAERGCLVEGVQEAQTEGVGDWVVDVDGDLLVELAAVVLLLLDGSVADFAVD